MNEAKLIDLLGNEVTATPYTLSDEHFITPVKLTQRTLEAIRQIVREEVAKALAEEDIHEEENYAPRILHVPEAHPRKITAELEHEGVMYRGILTEVEEKP